MICYPNLATSLRFKTVLQNCKIPHWPVANAEPILWNFSRFRTHSCNKSQFRRSLDIYIHGNNEKCTSTFNLFLNWWKLNAPVMAYSTVTDTYQYVTVTHHSCTFHRVLDCHRHVSIFYSDPSLVHLSWNTRLSQTRINISSNVACNRYIPT